MTEHFFEDLGALELEGRARHRGRLPRGAPVEQLAEAGGVVARPQRPFEQLEHLVVAGLPLVKGAEDRGGRITVAERIEQQASAAQVEASRLGAAVAHASSLAFEQGRELGVAAGELEQSGEGLGCVGGWRRQVEDLPAHGDGGLEIADRVFEHGREAGEGLRADRFGNSLAPRAQAAGLIRGAPEALIGVGQRLQCLESDRADSPAPLRVPRRLQSCRPARAAGRPVDAGIGFVRSRRAGSRADARESISSV